jgi:glycosyltransferase involved in cell wall biosynthesis
LSSDSAYDERKVTYTPLVSIIINNYNYARFLNQSIDSALAQTYPYVQVVVVDDGSTDFSRDIIAKYGSRIIAIYKENGGQGSAFNAGAAASRGQILCFLDADDVFHPGKVERIVQTFRERGLNSKPALMHNLLTIRNETGVELKGPTLSKTHPSPLNLYAFAKQHRFLWQEAGPTSTISINRALAHLLFPIPEKDVRISADAFIVLGASLVAEVHSLPETLSIYRVHGKNQWYSGSGRKPSEFERTLEQYLNAKLRENGLSPVISFGNSIWAWWKALGDRDWAKLFWLILKCCARDRDRYTFEMAYHVAMTIGMMTMRAVRQKRHAVRKMFTYREPTS